VVAYYGALWTLFIALQSPLETLAGQFFVAHMVQHMLLILVAAPVAYLWALPRSVARGITRSLNRVSAWLDADRWLMSSVTLIAAFVIVFWGWHHPRLYEAALASALIHSVEHIMFLVTAVAFWWTVIRAGRRRNRAGQAVGGLFIAMMQGTLLGVLLVFSEQVWYATYQNSGINPLQDQQLAGLVMWLPGGVLYTVLAGYYFVRSLEAIDARSR
jgi:cytochrome c oxidase assembly factor CtaG